MTTITVYDPPMCCATGVCGAEVDQRLVRFAADLDGFKTQGVAVRRISLSQAPMALIEEPQIAALMARSDGDALPRRSASLRNRMPDLPPLVDEIAKADKGLVMTMGKGGVGKTTIAAAVAVERAARGHDVLLTTTDPAAHRRALAGSASAAPADEPACA